MKYSPVIEAICDEIDKKERKKVKLDDVLEDIALTDKLLFAIGLAVFNDYQKQKKGGDDIGKRQEMCVSLGKN